MSAMADVQAELRLVVAELELECAYLQRTHAAWERCATCVRARVCRAVLDLLARDDAQPQARA